MEAHGVTCMSIGFLVPQDTAMIWRGPMVMGALEQMMGDVDWGPQDVLIVDMPPGTGNAFTMAQRFRLLERSSSRPPQDLSLIDAKKGLNMFRKVDVPVLGIVENMSYFICPSCGEQSDIFAHGDAASRHPDRGRLSGRDSAGNGHQEGGDNSTPIVAADPGEIIQAYRAIAESVWAKVSSSASQTLTPNISFE